MPNTTITDAEKAESQLRDIIYKEMEIEGYQKNIVIYEALLVTNPTQTWPVDLAKYKGFSSEKIAEQVPDTDVDTVSNLVAADRVAFLLKTERMQQKIPQRTYDVLIAADKDPATLTTRLQAKKTEIDAEIAAA